jgi:16S rRNA processing protein RimM
METVIIGVILRAHGVNGLVRARATGPTLAAVPFGHPIRITTTDGVTREVRLESRAAAGDTFLLGFDGIATREDAGPLRGGELGVDPGMLPPADEPGEYYVRDLVGCSVWAGAAALGTVRDVINRPANDVLDVVGPDGTAVLLPFSADAVREVDMAARRIELRSDLLDLNSGDQASGVPNAD